MEKAGKNFMNRLGCLSILIVALFVAPLTVFGQGLEKVRVVYASRGLPFFSAFVAKEMKFYQKHGLEVELIQMAPRIALTALATSQVDYSLNIGSTMRAAMRGAPVRAVASSTVAPFFALATKEPNIGALKGKILGVSDFGGTNFQVTKLVLAHYGMTALKDVQVLAIGEEKLILDALVSGRIHGAMLSPPWPFEAEKHGFKIILKASDVVQFPFAGICTFTDKIKNNREQIKKIIRAEIDALRYIRERRQENIDLIIKLFKMDKEIAQKSYDFAAVFFSRDARIQPEAARRLIALEKESGDIKGDIDVGNVADLSLVEEVLK
jgi:ABC-type nitrate/sulfonate/bicarbonate transport system substrate-binding protein